MSTQPVEDMLQSDTLPADWYSLVSQKPYFPGPHRVAFVIGSIAGLTMLNYFAPGNPAISMRLLATAIIVTGIYPTWRWLTGVDRGLPFMPYFSVLFVLYYAITIFLLAHYTVAYGGPTVGPKWIVRSLSLSLLSLVLILAAYYGSAGLLDRFTPRAKMRWTSLGNCKLLAIVWALIGFSTYALDRTITSGSQNSQFVVYLGNLLLVGMIMLFVLQLTRRLDRWSMLFLWCFLLPARMLLGFAAGSTEKGMSVALLLIFTYSAVQRRVPWKYLAVGMVAVFMIRPVMLPMRSLTRENGSVLSGSSITKKVNVFVHLIGIAVSGRIPYAFLFQFTAHRLSDNMIFADVVRQTPGVVAYWNGGSYEPLLYTFVPRFLYPEKPTAASGQPFGHRYGIIALEDHETSINLAQTMELYVNYGVTGIVLGSLLFGIIYRMIHSVFVHPEMGFGALVGAVFAFSNLFSIETGASMVFGGALWTFVFIGFVNLATDVGELWRVRR